MDDVKKPAYEQLSGRECFGLTASAPLKIPHSEAYEYVLLLGDGGIASDMYLARELQEDGKLEPMALIDAKTACGYKLPQGFASDSASALPDPRSENDLPAVKVTGDVREDASGQVLVLQEGGNYRRYSKWERAAATKLRPFAKVRTIPQCGCGGYLGAPMMFDSFAEMTAYFIVIFADSELPKPDSAACAVQALRDGD